MNEQEQIIQNILKSIMNLDITDLQARQLLLYYELLVEKNRVMNLTRITDFKDVVIKHFADSLAIVGRVPIEQTCRILDVGTGAGFPGIPLQILFPNARMTLMDSVGKKVRFVEEVSEKLGLQNVTAVHARAEDLARNPDHREAYDLVVSRAVANFSTLSEYCLPFVKTGGNFAAYKSGNSGDEIDNAKRAISLLGGAKPEIVQYELVGMSRVIIRTGKIRKTPAIYPRKAGMPSKHPL